MASPTLAASEEWNEPMWNGPEPRKKHRRYIWAVQYGCGSSGSGATGRKTRPAARLARSLADRPGAAAATTARQAAREAHKARPPRLYGTA